MYLVWLLTPKILLLILWHTPGTYNSPTFPSLLLSQLTLSSLFLLSALPLLSPLKCCSYSLITFPTSNSPTLCWPSPLCFLACSPPYLPNCPTPPPHPSLLSPYLLSCPTSLPNPSLWVIRIDHDIVYSS